MLKSVLGLGFVAAVAAGGFLFSQDDAPDMTTLVADTPATQGAMVEVLLPASLSENAQIGDACSMRTVLSATV